jgi:CYTH domain-containing protein
MGKKLEIERKFVIKLPKSWSDLGKLFDHLIDVKRIVQFYLEPDKDGISPRVRKTVEGLAGDTETVYHYNKKYKTSDPSTNKEEEKEISKEEYNKLVKKCHPDKKSVEKIRFLFKHEDHVFELDVFKNDLAGLALLEVELENKKDKVKIPPYLKVVKEVTDDDRYNNYELANKK